MAIFTFTQISGGVGATTLIANLTNLWANPSRIMVELGITGGDLARIMNFNALASTSPSTLVENGKDFGQANSQPIGLSELPTDKWELPVLPAPVMPDFPNPGEKMWWQKRVDLMLSAHMDVIVDMGRIAPEHLGIHNRVLNASTAIAVVVRDTSEAVAAASRLAVYQDRLAIVVVNKLYSLPSEISEATGTPCVNVFLWDGAITANTWRNVLVAKAKAKSVKQYLQATSELAVYLGGK